MGIWSIWSFVLSEAVKSTTLNIFTPYNDNHYTIRLSMYTVKQREGYFLAALHFLMLSISVLLPPESSLLELPGKIQTQESIVYEVMRLTIKTKLVWVLCLQIPKRKENMPDIFNHNGYKMQIRHPGTFLLTHKNALFIGQEATTLKVITHFIVFFLYIYLSTCENQ